MKQFFAEHRVYRASDRNYFTVGLKWNASSLSGLEAQIKAFEAGLAVAGASKVSIEQLFFDFPNTNKVFFEVDDPIIFEELQYFLGVKRDRRPKGARIVPKTEAQLGLDDAAQEKETDSEKAG